MNREKSEALFEKAKQYFPGGVNSPVRAFRSVGGTPLFIERGKGSHIWDADGNERYHRCRRHFIRASKSFDHYHQGLNFKSGDQVEDPLKMNASPIPQKRLFIPISIPVVLCLLFVPSANASDLKILTNQLGYEKRGPKHAEDEVATGPEYDDDENEGIPYIANSDSFHPAPMPISRRPPERWSTVTAIFARRPGWR